ncbi:MAG: methyltransferase domain-containing protein, partial [Chlamydiia bacterium]|nr:methyltransferase domain-containing protein [Chlamydiia bacterium]
MNLEEAIRDLCAPYSQKALSQAAQELSERYQKGKAHLTDLHRAAYIATRLPATYAVLKQVFSEISVPATILDCGAGPGTSIWALQEQPIEHLTLIEQDPAFIQIAQSLIPNPPFPTTWKNMSFLNLKETADLILFSYSLNEIPQETLSAVIANAHALTQNFLVVVEPGTPSGFTRVNAIRNQVLKLGMSLHAPCPHHNICPMTGTDWCHFAARLPRTALHRVLKKGALGHEDEKFSYLIASKTPHTPSGARIVRHPLKRKGHTLATLCTADGLIQKPFTGKERKNLHWGGVIPFLKNKL